MKLPLETGNRYGKWTVGDPTKGNTTEGTYYVCICDCGTKRVHRISTLRCGYSKQCLACKGKDQRGKTYKRKRKPVPRIKVCRKCNVMKPIGDYYKYIQTVFNNNRTYTYETIQSRCKVCWIAKVNKAREKKIDKGTERK